MLASHRSDTNGQCRVLTNHIPLDEAISLLSRHMDHSIRKSTTPHEGLLPITSLPVEGDVLYGGKSDEHIQLRHFYANAPNRPHSIASDSGLTSTTHTAQPSEASPYEPITYPNAQKMMDEPVDIDGVGRSSGA